MSNPEETHKRRITSIMVGALVTILILPVIAMADCSLGANPLHMNVQAVPGETVVVTWNLYNIHGDRTTHVVLDEAEENPGWEFFFDPEIHEGTYNVTGVIKTIDENVGLAPTDVIDVVPDPKPQGYDYVNYPGGDGYIPVMPIDIFIKVPKDSELLKDYVLTFQATGNCFMETGTVIPGIATKLEVKLRTVSGEPFYETPVITPPEQKPNNEEGQETGNQDTTLSGDSITGFIEANGMPITAGIIILFVALFLVARSKKKGRSQNQGPVGGGYNGQKYTWNPR